MDYLQVIPAPASLNHHRSLFGAAVLKELASLRGVWTGRIRVPGQKKRNNNDGFTIHHTLFIRSLGPLLDLPLIAHARPAQIAVLLNSYWAGIAKVLPQPFNTVKPQNYTIQKYHGVAVLHSVLPQVIHTIPAWGRSLADPIAYADAMHDLPTLTGATLTEDGVTLVSDASFWLTGPAGASTQFVGTIGRRKLADKIRALIPQPPEGLEA